ncbi:MAG: choice-of-anchor Q domain-containing protein [Thermoleophilaceae bacterium]
MGAIASANGHPGPDVVQLGRGCTYKLTVANNHWYGPNALPAIASDVTIQGNGSKILRDSSALPPNFRFFFVGANPKSASTLNYVSPGPGRLTLRDLTLDGGSAKGGDTNFGGAGAGLGGAIFSQGALVIERSLLIDNRAQGGSAGNASFGGSGGGGGIGTDATAANADGGGFGAGAFGGAAGGSGDATNGAGGAGFRRGESGNASSAGGAGGGPQTGLGGLGGDTGSVGGDGGGGGGGGFDGGSGGFGGGGGGFGAGGHAQNSGAFTGGGGGGPGGGGGAGGPSSIGVNKPGGGGGGFGAGGGSYDGGGGFGGGGGFPHGPGGFGGGSGAGGASASGGGGGMGGAIFNMQGTVTIRASTLTQNLALGGAGSSAAAAGQGFGGAVFNLNGSFTAVGSTLASNFSSEGDNGIDLYNLVYDAQTARAAQTTLRATILGYGAANTGTAAEVASDKPGTVAGGLPNLGAANVDAGHFDLLTSQRMVGSGTITGAPLTLDPKLGNLHNNGGPTQTMAPAAGSPVIDAGFAFGLPTDQRGVPRPFDFQSTPNVRGGDGSDIGAVELAPSFGAKTLVTLKLGAARIGASGSLPVVVSNGNNFPVSGSLSGKSARAVRVAAHKKRHLRLKEKAFRLAARGQVTVTLTLPKKLRALLKDNGKLRVILSAHVLDPSRHGRRVTRPVTLRPKK